MRVGRALFLTNFEELAKCTTPEFISLAALVAVKALCEYAGVEFKDPDENPSYRVGR